MTHATFKANVVDDDGNIQPNSTITIRDAGGALIPPAQLFSDKDLTVPFTANPYTTASDGFIEFYILPQTVSVEAQKGALVKNWDSMILNAENGTAAYADLTTSKLDTTTGRVLKVDDFGVGTDDLDDKNADSVDGTGWFRDTSGGFYQYFGSTSLSQAEVMQMVRLPTAQTSQFAIKNGSSSGVSRAAIRHRGADGPWSDIQELWTFGNTTVDINGFIKEL